MQHSTLLVYLSLRLFYDLTDAMTQELNLGFNAHQALLELPIVDTERPCILERFDA